MNINLPLIFVILLMLGCSRADLYDLPRSSDITKSDLERIGEYARDQILADPVTWPLLSAEEKHPDLTRFLDDLYIQATWEIKSDYKSPDSNRWCQSRNWEIYILNDADPMAFILPSGDCFLSKGLLQKLSNASELYYILATEAVLLRDRHLKKQMVQAYSAPALYDLAKGSDNLDPRLGTLLDDLPYFDYDIEAATDIRASVMELICNTSIYDPISGARLDALLSTAAQWIRTRPIPRADDVRLENCGELRSNGGYKKYVLDHL